MRLSARWTCPWTLPLGGIDLVVAGGEEVRLVILQSDSILHVVIRVNVHPNCVLLLFIRNDNEIILTRLPALLPGRLGQELIVESSSQRNYRGSTRCSITFIMPLSSALKSFKFDACSPIKRNFKGISFRRSSFPIYSHIVTVSLGISLKQGHYLRTSNRSSLDVIHFEQVLARVFTKRDNKISIDRDHR